MRPSRSRSRSGASTLAAVAFPRFIGGASHDEATGLHRRPADRRAGQSDVLYRSSRGAVNPSATNGAGSRGKRGLAEHVDCPTIANPSSPASPNRAIKSPCRRRATGGPAPQPEPRASPSCGSVVIADDVAVEDRTRGACASEGLNDEASSTYSVSTQASVIRTAAGGARASQDTANTLSQHKKGSNNAPGPADPSRG